MYGDVDHIVSSHPFEAVDELTNLQNYLGGTCSCSVPVKSYRTEEINDA